MWYTYIIKYRFTPVDSTETRLLNLFITFNGFNIKMI